MPALVKLLAAAAPAAEPDADLLARFVATRDDAAFAELVRRHGPAVYGTCRRLVGPAAADDAFQATFLVLAARAGSVRKAASVGSWLVGVAGRVARRMRLRARRQETGDGKQPEPACSMSPDSCLLSHELGEALADEFTRLPDRLRAAAVACLVNGHTQEQAAAALGWSSRTVRRRLDEAKGLLRTRLERRGVTPAVAAAAVAAAGEAGALPTGLARRATDSATLFLAGGGADARAAALAHGVIGTMTTTRSTTAAAACAAVLAGIGIGWANDAPQPAPKAVKAEPDRIPAPAAPKAPPAPKAPEPAAGHEHRTANFVVSAPTAAVARALGDEFERQRKAVAIEWLGKELPAWKEPARVVVQHSADARAYTGGIRYRPNAHYVREQPIGGTLEKLLGQEAHRWATRLVLVSANGDEFYWWGLKGIDALSDPAPDQLRDLAGARQELEAGRAFRLEALFKMGAAPPAGEGIRQASSVVRFLLERTPDRRFIMREDYSFHLYDQQLPLAAGQSAAKHGLFMFLRLGRYVNWLVAARDIYGFASVSEMEQAWIDWLRAQPGAEQVVPPVHPDRIPPTELTTPRAEPETAGAATHLTANFAVSSPSIQASATVAAAAERHRKELAKRWLGKEIPAAKEPIPVKVILTAGNSGGATTFTFGEADGKRPPGVKSAAMELRGPLDTTLKSTLPHEVAHVVLATHFGRPLPRWADEGIAVLAESEAEQKNHDVRARELLNAGRAIRLSTLFRMTEYPRDSVVTFAQGYSVCRFLLARGAADPHPGGPPGVRAHKAVRYAHDEHEARFAKGDREPALLAFLALGMYENSTESWALAAKEVYGFDSLDALEQAWIDSLRPTGAPVP